MDVFGIGAAFRGALRIFLHSQRGTGRTTLLLSVLQPGDEVVFADLQQARAFEQALRQRVPAVAHVRTRVCPVENTQSLMGVHNPHGRVIFDHVWVERFYARALDSAIGEVVQMQEQMSPRALPKPQYDPRWAY